MADPGKQAPTDAEVLAALGGVRDPELHRDLVSLGMVRGVAVAGHEVRVALTLTTPACPFRERIVEEVRGALQRLPGVAVVEVEVLSDLAAGPPRPGQTPHPGIKHLVGVAGAKGGTGASTLAVNLAVALAETGARVGLLEVAPRADVLNRLLGLDEREVEEAAPSAPAAAHGIHAMSAGFVGGDGWHALWPEGPGRAAAWRRLVEGVAWGPLDYLLADLPGGPPTLIRDLAAGLPFTGTALVVTPQELTVDLGVRAVAFLREEGLPVLGLIENLSFFMCPFCFKGLEVFGQGAGRRLSAQVGVPLLGEVPLDREVALASDRGEPVPLALPRSPIAEVFRRVAANLAGRISVEALGAQAAESPRTPSRRTPGGAPVIPLRPPAGQAPGRR